MKETNPITIGVIVLVAGVFLWYVVGDPPTKPATSKRARSEQTEWGTGKVPKGKSATAFGKMKSLAENEVYHGHRVTFFCGCPFDYSKTVDIEACGYEPDDADLATYDVVWRRIVPTIIANPRFDCWKGGDPACSLPGGERIKRRKCCELLHGSSEYKQMKQDLHNIVPVIREIHRQRKASLPSEIAGEKREFGACDFELVAEDRIYEPADSIQGDVARAYLYLADTYKMELKSEERRRMLKWHKADPPDEWEKERNRRIKKLQKRGNPYIESAEPESV